jgi:hypothetical protein
MFGRDRKVDAQIEAQVQQKLERNRQKALAAEKRLAQHRADEEAHTRAKWRCGDV